MNHEIETNYNTGELMPMRNSVAQSRADAGVAAVEAEARVMESAAKIVPTMVDGGMAPDRYLPTHQPTKNSKPQGRDVALQKALAAAVYGATLGFGVAKSLQNVFTVHGQPAVYARTMLAQVQSYGHEVWTEEAGPTSVTVSARRRGSDHIESSTWTIQRAEEAGFTRNAKYKSQPEEMLYAKAVSTVCRRAFADVLEGIPFTVEDLQLEQQPIKATATRQPTGGVAALKARAKEPEPQQEIEQAPVDNQPDLAAELLDQIGKQESEEGLGKVMADAADLLESGDIDQATYNTIRDTGRSKWQELQA